MNPPPKYKMAVVIWLSIYPSITLLLYFLGSSLTALPLMLRTLVLTLILVPTMVFGLLPFMTRVFARWLHKPQ